MIASKHPLGQKNSNAPFSTKKSLKVTDSISLCKYKRKSPWANVTAYFFGSPYGHIFSVLVEDEKNEYIIRLNYGILGAVTHS